MSAARSPFGTKLTLEPLEAREVPAAMWWVGDPNNLSAGSGANWKETASVTVYPTAGQGAANRVPNPFDDVVFSGTVSNLGCTSLGTAGGYPPYVTEYASVTLKDN